VSSFIGPETELAEVRSPVSRSRLVTLTGAGKTRLGLAGADRVVRAGRGLDAAELVLDATGRRRRSNLERLRIPVRAGRRRRHPYP
jgi:hypothetical protein